MDVFKRTNFQHAVALSNLLPTLETMLSQRIDAQMLGLHARLSNSLDIAVCEASSLS